MLNLSRCDIRQSASRPVAAGVGALEEGIGLNGVLEGGVLKVKAGVGAANTEAFAGFALNERTAPALFPMVLQNQKVVLIETGVYGVRINKPVVGTAQIRYAATNTAVTLDAGGGLVAGEYALTTASDGGNIIRVDSTDLGKALNIIYSYAPTVQDLILLGGDNSPVTFTPITTFIGETSVIEGGTVYTSNYDVTIDWASWVPATGLKITANGVVGVAAGTGATVTNGRVVEAPTQDVPFLGISFRV